MKNINLSNGVERNYYGVSETYANELISMNHTLLVNEESGIYTEYDKEGNDLDTFTYEELQNYMNK